MRSRRAWEALPVVHDNHGALLAGLRPGEYRRRGETYEGYLAALGADGAPAHDRHVVEDVDGLSLRLQIERRSNRPAAISPAALRDAIDRLVRAALDDLGDVAR